MRWSSVSAHELRRSPPRGGADADPDHGHPGELREAAARPRSGPAGWRPAMAANATRAVPSLNRLSFSTIVRRRAGRLAPCGRSRPRRWCRWRPGSSPAAARRARAGRGRSGGSPPATKTVMSIPGHGEEHDRPHVRAQPAQVGGDRGLEQQDGQEDLDDDLGVEGDARHLGRAHGRPRHHQRDVVVDAEPPRREPHRGRDQQQRGERGQAVMHAGLHAAANHTGRRRAGSRPPGPLDRLVDRRT